MSEKKNVNVFANDGSFLQMFQQQMAAKHTDDVQQQAKMRNSRGRRRSNDSDSDFLRAETAYHGRHDLVASRYSEKEEQEPYTDSKTLKHSHHKSHSYSPTNRDAGDLKFSQSSTNCNSRDVHADSDCNQVNYDYSKDREKRRSSGSTEFERTRSRRSVSDERYRSKRKYHHYEIEERIRASNDCPHVEIPLSPHAYKMVHSADEYPSPTSQSVESHPSGENKLENSGIIPPADDSSTHVAAAVNISQNKRASQVDNIVNRRRAYAQNLKTGMVKKKKFDDDKPEATDAWTHYMQEVEKYKSQSCLDEDATRPLVK